MINKLLIIILFYSSIVNAKTINVAIASNVNYVMDALKKEFIKYNPDIKINIILGSSGKLATQIQNAAPYDIFMSANEQYPQNLHAKKIAITKPKIYAKGLLICFSKSKQDFNKGLGVVKKLEIEKIIIANPKIAPYGMAALEVLNNSNLYEKIKNKLIYAESVSQTVFYTMLTNGIGFISKATLYSSNMKIYKENEHWINIDRNLYNPIRQSIVILKHGQNNNAVKEFYEFILSKNAKKIFQNFGYITS